MVKPFDTTVKIPGIGNIKLLTTQTPLEAAVEETMLRQKAEAARQAAQRSGLKGQRLLREMTADYTARQRQLAK